MWNPTFDLIDFIATRPRLAREAGQVRISLVLLFNKWGFVYFWAKLIFWGLFGALCTPRAHALQTDFSARSCLVFSSQIEIYRPGDASAPSLAEP